MESSINTDTTPNFDEEKSHEKISEEVSSKYDDFIPQEFDVTSQMSTTLSPSLPSLTNSPTIIHPTHVNTNTINPTNFSEAVIIQTHLETHRLKGSQNDKEWFKKVFISQILLI